MFHIDPHTELNLPTRVTREVDPDRLERLARDNGPEFSAALYDAEVRGDMKGIFSATTVYLRTATATPVGRSRDRLVLGAALAQVSDPKTVADLALIPQQLDDALILAELVAIDFGSRKPNALDCPFAQAHRRAEIIKRELRAMSAGTPSKPWELARELSLGGALHVAEAIAKALTGTGNGAYAEVAAAAVRRRNFSDPRAAIEACDAVLEHGPNSAAYNCKAASLGDLGTYRNAFENACLGLAVKPNDYSAWTSRRAFANAGFQLHNFFDAIILAYKLRIAPPGRGSDYLRYAEEMAAEALTLAGRRDLAELTLSRVRIADRRGLLVRSWVDDNAVTK